MPFRPDTLSYPCIDAGKKLLLCLLILLVLPTWLHGGQDAGLTTASEQNSLERQYKKAKDHYLRLERDPGLGRERDNWLAGVRNFRRIYLAAPKGALAPSCLYMMARMHQRMYYRFQKSSDLDDAISYYNDVVTIFPDNRLADDALFAMAEIQRRDRKNPLQAVRLYEKLVKQFADGDKYAPSLSRLQELAKKYNIQVPDRLSHNNLQNLVNVLPVKYWSSSDYTRIVIRASQPVHYSARLLEKEGDKPRRLYIDFSQSYIPPRFRSPIPIQDGLLKQVRTGQFNPTTVRVVLDIESISDYKIFSLNDPFRVIVDVHGRKKDRVATTDSPATPPPAAVTEGPRGLAGNQNVRQEMTDSLSGRSPSIITLTDRKKKKPVSRESNNEPGLSSLSLAQQLGLGVRRIVIDPGHGGKDPGAMAHGLKEKNIVLQVARKTREILRQRYGYEVLLTRDRDIYLPLEERTAIANTSNADLFLSIHVNAHPKKSARGIETFYLNLATNTEAMRVAARENATSTHNISDLQDILTDLMKNSKIEESSRLARYVQNSLVNGLKKQQPEVKDLGVKQAPFYVLIGAEMPAILAEISFITNPQEARLLAQPSYLEEIARQIAAGVAQYVDHHTTAALTL
ncbi:N-acetylmuramoyl-L-alanine amidase [Desulfolithobacter sp.]